MEIMARVLCWFPLSDQWKPINPEEKKKYDREFLLGFQFISASMNKPEGLPAISDVVLDKVQLFKTSQIKDISIFSCPSKFRTF